jgi:hypothetical protein
MLRRSHARRSRLGLLAGALPVIAASQHMESADRALVDMQDPSPTLLWNYTTCDGASANLAADQCTAWQAFWDGTHSNGNWVYRGAGCTRTDPCNLACGSGGGVSSPTCNTGGTSIINIDLPGSNLEGTISPLVGAWADITSFYVSSNALSGPIPASVDQWAKLTKFYVWGNEFNGLLPAGTPFSQMTGCYLLSTTATNKFECPWPVGAKVKCAKFPDGSPITDADCTMPAAFACVDNQCVARKGGLPKAVCEANCGHSLTR